MKRVAVLDLGTNTFYLLIADIQDGTIAKVYQERIYTKLGQEGTDRIGDASYQRGMDALSHFSQIIVDHCVTHVKALGTAALRQASNGSSFIQEVANEHGIHIEVIDGLAEADYIYQGVRLAIPDQSSPYLVMDIGGGSVEFIIAEGDAVVYKESFQIGLSPVHAVKDISDIAEKDDVVEIHRWLTSKLPNLYSAIQEHQPRSLIGSAGAFEVLVSMTGTDMIHDTCWTIAQDQIAELYVKILGSSKVEKRTMPGLPSERVDYISAALVLIWHIIDSLQPDQIMVSKYALKEGALSSFLD